LVGQGSILSSLKRFEEAREYYERATKADPNFALAYTDWGIALANLGRHKEKYKRATELDSNTPSPTPAGASLWQI
jgi:tetratricopeptide (TPR) repeat protein